MVIGQWWQTVSESTRMWLLESKIAVGPMTNTAPI